MTPPDKNNPGIRYAPLERAVEGLLAPFEAFIHRQTASGLVLMAAAALALLLANSPLAAAYRALQHVPLTVALGGWSLGMSLHHWVNDGLMAFFFFVIGLELKREVFFGALAGLRKAVLPVAAAAGGMVFPAVFYLFFNPAGVAARGWGVPMATDIAFAVGAMVLLGGRVPRELIAFLVALAIVDDLGAVLAIALYYTHDISLPPLLAAAGLAALLLVFNLAGIRRAVPYFAVAVALWYALLLSGIHPTLAGVLGAFAVPARPKYDPEYFSARARELLAHFETCHRDDPRHIMNNAGLKLGAQAMESAVLNVMTPLQRLEHIWHLPVSFLAMPVFALFNAGIALGDARGAWGLAPPDPVLAGIFAGLVGGKFIGITATCWLALRLRLAALPENTSFAQVAAAGLLAGIGFTMSMFISQLAFEGHEDLLLAAKTGIFLASLAAGAGGVAWLWLLGRRR